MVQTNCKAVVRVKLQSKNQVDKNGKKMQSTVTNANSTGSFMRSYCTEVKNQRL